MTDTGPARTDIDASGCEADPAGDRTVAVVVGPTAVGKTALAGLLCTELGGEVVSADSMQVYRGMDIGTAKPRHPSVAHHCIDLVDPDEDYSAARYQDDARAAIAEVHGRGRLPIVAGGTGLYVRAAVDDLRFPPGHTGTATRERLEREARELGGEALYRRLQEVDPEAAAYVHPNNTRRVVRALEMAEHGESYADVARRFRERRSVYPVAFVGVHMEREALYPRIDRRVDRMLEDGLLDEVDRLLRAGYRDALTASQAIGYKEFVPVLEGDRPLEEAVEEVKRATRRYAKRQMTWFRADPRIPWIDVTRMPRDEALDGCLGLLGTTAPKAHAPTYAPGMTRTRPSTSKE